MWRSCFLPFSPLQQRPVAPAAVGTWGSQRPWRPVPPKEQVWGLSLGSSGLGGRKLELLSPGRPSLPFPSCSVSPVSPS